MVHNQSQYYLTVFTYENSDKFKNLPRQVTGSTQVIQEFMGVQYTINVDAVFYAGPAKTVFKEYNNTIILRDFINNYPFSGTGVGSMTLEFEILEKDPITGTPSTFTQTRKCN